MRVNELVPFIIAQLVGQAPLHPAIELKERKERPKELVFFVFFFVKVWVILNRDRSL